MKLGQNYFIENAFQIIIIIIIIIIIFGKTSLFKPQPCLSVWGGPESLGIFVSSP
jgi:hypothetical protein